MSLKVKLRDQGRFEVAQGMIETTIAGIWHLTPNRCVLALIGGSLNAFQAQIVVNHLVEATQKALEVKSEASGKEMIGVVLPLDLDFSRRPCLKQKGAAFGRWS